MKIYVGTLYSGENEYEECLASIRSQTYRNFDHFVFSDLPKREAHRALFTSFLQRASEYDVLIKVDADMVLSNDSIFAGIVRKLTENTWAEVLSVMVHDLFSNRLIWGLNAWRNTARWSLDSETLFTDIADVPESRHLTDERELAPAAIHCKNPSPLQALHYGTHRGLKSIQMMHSISHWSLLQGAWENFRKTGDVRIGLAVLGAELVYAGRLTRRDVDYTDPRMKSVLEGYLPLDRTGLDREIRRLRARNWGILPSDLRRRTIRALRSERVSLGILNELALLAKQTAPRIRRRWQKVV